MPHKQIRRFFMCLNILFFHGHPEKSGRLWNSRMSHNHSSFADWVIRLISSFLLFFKTNNNTPAPSLWLTFQMKNLEIWCFYAK